MVSLVLVDLSEIGISRKRLVHAVISCMTQKAQSQQPKTATIKKTTTTIYVGVPWAQLVPNTCNLATWQVVQIEAYITTS